MNNSDIKYELQNILNLLKDVTDANPARSKLPDAIKKIRNLLTELDDE